MTRRRRHAAAEIAAKLREGDALAAAGRSQGEIARALGISVMTFHRWRKARPQPDHRNLSDAQAVEYVFGNPERTEREARIAELQVENARLRKLVTDLLLERMQLDDKRAS